MKWRVIWDRAGILHLARELVEDGSPVDPVPMACGLWPKNGEGARCSLWSPHYTWKEIIGIHNDEGDEFCSDCLAVAQLEELTR